MEVHLETRWKDNFNGYRPQHAPPEGSGRTEHYRRICMTSQQCFGEKKIINWSITHTPLDPAVSMKKLGVQVLEYPQFQMGFFVV